MTARKQKGNTNPHPVDSTTRTCCGGIGDHTAECPPALRFFDTGAEPVDLDPPAPAIANWNALTGEVDIEHGGDASKVVTFPRPAWSDPSEDFIGNTLQNAGYASAVARVAASLEKGCDDGDTLEPARVGVQTVKAMGADVIQYGVEITFSRAIGKDEDKPWVNSMMTLTIEETMELVHVLRAAVALAEADQ